MAEAVANGGKHEEEASSHHKPKELQVPRPVYTRHSPCSSPYFKKLPPLSPRSMKMIDPNFSFADFSYPHDPTSSAESNFSSYDSGYSASPIEGQAGYDEGRKASTSSSNAEQDIEFFLQVVGVFREYTADQISMLESKLKENVEQLEPLHSELKKIEANAAQQETQLCRDFAHITALIHRKQAELSEMIKKENACVAASVDEQVRQCQRNAKLISGVINFAKKLRSESEESLRENAVRELKQRLAIASEIPPPEPLPLSATCARIDMDLAEQLVEKIDFVTREERRSAAPVLLAAHPDDDISRNSLTVRWLYPCHSGDVFQVKWWYFKGDFRVNGEAKDISCNRHTITNLPANRKVFVIVRSSYNNANWCEPGCFRTLQAPVKFCFDVSTAHVKLSVSPDGNTVFYPGDDKCSASPKSPSRFTFALNVLGNVSFYSGRHYWEVGVNRDGWAVGVASSNIPRNSWFGSSETSWILHYNASKHEYKVRSGGEAVIVKPIRNEQRRFLKRVGVYLDFEAGTIRFVDCKHEEVLFTYSVESFEESLCAAVNPFYHGGGLTLFTGLDVPKYLL